MANWGCDVTTNCGERGPKLLIIEPFYGGSHKEHISCLIEGLIRNGIGYTLVTLSPKKWHWRARCSALMLRDKIPEISTEEALFCSSILNLPELLGLRPDLCQLRKVVYFHENQSIYPVKQVKERDVQYAYNEITTSLAADLVLFNSNFNRTSFLENINKIIRLFPDNRPKGIREQIEDKSKVLYYPMKYPVSTTDKVPQNSILHIVWPHRWEFDKGPEDFFDVILELKRLDCKFHLSVLGQVCADVPLVFHKATEELQEEIVHFGYLKSKDEYFEVLRACDVVVSTAKHEFFGVSTLEATYCGCLPLVPNNLVYPEIYPEECLYKSLNDLCRTLQKFCSEPKTVRELRRRLCLDFSKYCSKNLIPEYINVLAVNE
ncbi:hypothetical protein NQ315_006287 [Exocentrus adspersus]|uniref:tRNA-queuosine alpha-mannosyltransferase n=1 Tax=Exocentrus adspersus TaxID=1586481 RepID=A0AAV8VZT5_9CUCU|nr:hypothetical protein NQ315_006287 [Exocentrus adspersus]